MFDGTYFGIVLCRQPIEMLTLVDKRVFSIGILFCMSFHRCHKLPDEIDCYRTAVLCFCNMKWCVRVFFFLKIRMEAEKTAELVGKKNRLISILHGIDEYVLCLVKI